MLTLSSLENIRPFIMVWKAHRWCCRGISKSMDLKLLIYRIWICSVMDIRQNMLSEPTFTYWYWLIILTRSKLCLWCVSGIFPAHALCNNVTSYKRSGSPKIHMYLKWRKPFRSLEDWVKGVSSGDPPPPARIKRASSLNVLLFPCCLLRWAPVFYSKISWASRCF